MLVLITIFLGAGGCCTQPKQEVKPEVKQEVKQEIKPEVKKDVKKKDVDIYIQALPDDCCIIIH